MPVVSLFQDIDYEHKIFCKHAAQVIDGNGVETYEPRVSHIFMATAILSGADLTKAQTDFVVPTEATTSVLWIAPTGNDTTGNGSKATPYRTLEKVKNAAVTTIYARTGDYTLTAQLTITGTGTISYKGVGRCSFTNYAGAIGVVVQRSCNWYGFIITGGAGATYTFYQNTGGVVAHASNCSFTGPYLYGINLTNCIVLGGAQSIRNCYVRGCYLSATSNINMILCTELNYNKGICRVVVEPISDMIVKYNKITVASGQALYCYSTADANKTGIEIEYNHFESTTALSYIVYVGGNTETIANAINGLLFRKNKIINNYVGVGTCHTLFIGGGINQSVKWNDITASNGYGIVVKSGSVAYTTTDEHIAYNVIRCTGNLSYAILVKMALSVRIGNNTVINFIDGNVFAEDTGTEGSALFINNMVTLAANATALSVGDSATSRNNSINKMGFTCTVGDDDDETAVTLDANGVPSAAINAGEEVTGDNNIGLASDYSIPDAITYKTQGAEWQRGAVLI